MIDLASIRNASFTLTPTGYNPEEVDRFLADLADQLAEGLAAAPTVPQYESHPHFDAEPEPAFVAEPAFVLEPAASREPTDIDGLRLTIERTISAMDSFVANELTTLKSATELETEELLRERERILDEAGDAARAHLEETRTRAEGILAEARRDADAMRARFEGELQVDRERFEQALADRDAQAQARVAELLAEAEQRRRDADERIASATRVQTQVLASLEHARASLSPSEPTPVAFEHTGYGEDLHSVEPYSDAPADAFSAEAGEADRYDGTNDAAA